MKIFIFLSLVMVVSATSHAQSVLKGRVIDQQTNEPLQGATITDGRTSIITNNNGEFNIEMTKKNDSLMVSYVGYENEIIKIADEDRYLNIRLSPSSVSLNEVIVAGYESNRKLLETAGGVALITKNELQRNNGVSLQPALNSIPGVHMDQSHSEDARISIRGVGIQSNFGIRNLKVYINDIPLTEANGFTRIEGLDVSTLGRVEIIKGPASSIYGAALGGVLLFQTEKPPYDQTSIDESVVAGSYGLFRSNTTVESGTDNSNIVASYGYQTLNGYRRWSSDQRNFLSATGQFYPNKKQTVSFFLNHSEQKAHIPGALDSLEFAEDPTQADSTTLSKKAGRYENWTRGGLSQSYRFNDHFSNETSINLGFFSLDHPLAFAYIRGTYQSFGGRTHFSYKNQFGQINTNIIFGAEYLNGLYLNKYYDNNEGHEGAISEDQQTTAIQYSYFAQAEFELPKDLLLTLGASKSVQEYKLKDFLKKNGVDFTGNKNFQPAVSPRIALLKTFRKKNAVYVTISSAFMPPVDYEISLPSGGINKNLKAVKGINYEIGARGDILDSKLHYDVSVYNLRLSNELIPQTVAPYQVIYVNAGKTNHNGVECALSYLVLKDNNKTISLLKPYLAYSHNDFSFKKYILDDIDYSGNKLTGIAPNILNVGIDAKSRFGIYMNASCYFQDAFPMTDDNTKYNDAYSVLDAKLGFRKTINHFGFDIYTGINNGLDTKYASYVELNATAFAPGALPKFYNPSPGRNYYGGLSLKYIF